MAGQNISAAEIAAFKAKGGRIRKFAWYVRTQEPEAMFLAERGITIRDFVDENGRPLKLRYVTATGTAICENYCGEEVVWKDPRFDDDQPTSDEPDRRDWYDPRERPDPV